MEFLERYVAAIKVLKFLVVRRPLICPRICELGFKRSTCFLVLILEASYAYPNPIFGPEVSNPCWKMLRLKTLKSGLILSAITIKTIEQIKGT